MISGDGSSLMQILSGKGTEITYTGWPNQNVKQKKCDYANMNVRIKQLFLKNVYAYVLQNDTISLVSTQANIKLLRSKY